MLCTRSVNICCESACLFCLHGLELVIPHNFELYSSCDTERLHTSALSLYLRNRLSDVHTYVHYILKLDEKRELCVHSESRRSVAASQ